MVGYMQKSEETEEMRALVSQIAKALVDASDHVFLDAVQKEGGTVFRLRVATEDVGKVIGKQGRTARSIRTILAAVGMKYRHRFSLEIIEEHSQPRAHSTELTAAH
jgi:predicted RNA-binding protein YlqC (UPF0109 family)